MPNAIKTDATQILKEWSEGDKGAPARLIPLIYEELRRRAARQAIHQGQASRLPLHLPHLRDGF
jgi:ribosomal protein S20